MAANERPRGAARLRTVLPRRWWLYPLVVVPVCVAGASWWLTEPLEDRGATPLPASANAPPVAISPEVAAGVAADAPATWPDGRLDGEPAKRLLLDLLVRAGERLNGVEGYTATFRKQERLKGELGAVQTLEMKVRHKPFAVYLKFVEPQKKKGHEVVYAEGRHDNKVIGHSGGLARLLVPRLAVAPDHPLALADSRHPITEAGLANLTAKLIRFRQLDMGDHEATTVLDRLTDAQGRVRFRSVHEHLNFHSDRPFARVEVLYDPDTLYPVDIRSFDWPKNGQTGDLLLAEHYSYDAVNVDAELTTLDFDPANPEYAFHRY